MSCQAGDVGLAHGSGLVDWAIRFAEARKYGRSSAEAQFNHAFMIVDSSGLLIEAKGRGVVSNMMAKAYPGDSDHVVIRPPYQPGCADKAVAAMKAMLGDKYGFVEIASEALAFFTGTKFRFGIEGQHICSGAVSDACQQGGIDMGDDDEWNSPADVMKIALDQKWSWVAGATVPGLS